MPLNYPFLTVELVNIHFHNLQAKPIKTRNTIEWLITSFTVLSFMIDQIAFPLSQVFFVQSFFNSYDWKMNSTFGLCDVRQNIT